MTRRHSFSRKERGRLFALYAGCCYLCDGKITAAQAWEIEHVIPWELTRDNSDSNLRLAHKKCHAVKTAKDIRELRHSDRVRDRNNGTLRSANPFPGSRRSRFKKLMSGQTILRDEATE